MTIEDEDLRVLLIMAHRYASYRNKDGSQDTVDELWEKYGEVLREDDRIQAKKSRPHYDEVYQGKAWLDGLAATPTSDFPAEKDG